MRYPAVAQAVTFAINAVGALRSTLPCHRLLRWRRLPGLIALQPPREASSWQLLTERASRRRAGQPHLIATSLLCYNVSVVAVPR